MNLKRLSFLSFAALTQVALAQSSVTIYGLVDLGVAKGNGGSATSFGANGTNKEWQVQQAASSRLGFRGTEDLGGGFSAQFSLEHRFLPDTGVPSNATTFWAGNSYVQLTQQGLGSVWMGRNYVPAFYVSVKSDPFGWDGPGQWGPQSFGLYRFIQGNNTLGFKSAKFGDALSFSVSYSAGEGTAANENGLNVEYASGPLYAGFGYDKLSKGPAATDGDSLMNLAVHYDFGFVKPRLYFARSKTTGGTRDSNEFGFGLSAPIGSNGRLKAAYLTLNPWGANNTQKKLSLGYEHAFSKLTNLYFDGSQAKEEAKTNNTTFQVGIKKLF